MTAPTPRPAAYSSPLPTPRPHLGHAVASEWTKMISVRSTVLTLGALVLLVVGIGLLAVAQTSAENFSGTPFTAPALFGLLVGQLGVMVLGVLTMTSEHGTGLIRTTFTAAPDRHRVLTAKYLVVGGVGFTAVAGSVTLVALAGAIVHHRPGAGRHDIPGELLDGLAGSLYVTLLGVLALAVGALVRHSAGGIAVMIGVVTVPPFTGAMLSMWEATQPAGSTLIRYNAPVALMQLFGLPNTDTGAIPPAWVHFALLLLVTGAAVAGSYLVVGRRDV
ncbi:ABC transporter permease [Streptomyces antimicrobicus]|uniref:ABC transporter permease n=1 Tax=Streptomyces antimicrobicus TaxID=2883108 RepID=A0ABS8AZR6_9ACTN|nr:ABC transporter permease [Streptomyces antimicrobicus]MCB5177846.1 ABC transporter permease [Streptomyces antimicrobicus]